MAITVQFADLVAAIPESSVEGAHRYLIVDTAATRPVNIGRSCGLQTHGVDLLTGESCDWSNSASPVLLRLPERGGCDEVLPATRQTLELWKLGNCFVYLESLFNTDTVTQALRLRTNAVLPQNMPVLLRYFDSRVFDSLMKTLSQSQRQSFLGIGTRWAVPNRRGELLDWPVTQQGFEKDSFEVPLLLDETQEAALIDACEADVIIDILLNQNNAQLVEALPPEQHEMISDALAAARTFGVETSTDQVAFCSLWLELGPHFFDVEPWAVPMLQLRERRSTLTDVMTRVGRLEAA